MGTPSFSAPSLASLQLSYSNASYFPVPFHLQQSAETVQPQCIAPFVGAPSATPAVQIPASLVVAPVYPAPATVAGVYSSPQYQQAQQLFQRDAQTITPEALESVKAAIANGEVEHKAEIKKKAIPRKAAGQTWEDPTLAEWPENDYRLFCGDLGNEVNDDVLSKAFSRFPSFNMARVNTLETGPLNYRRVSGRRGQIMRLWKNRRTKLRRNQNCRGRVFCTSDL